ncbi:MAG: MFS transporter [Elusimicrobiota bacterium]|jgi:MFS family permease|nr:MFS transporter [Elusimicrobiota bacterium]
MQFWSIRKRVPLWTGNFICIWASNFLLFFSFYLLMPTLPFYLANNFKLGWTEAGAIISLYVVASVLIKPFTAYVADTFNRKHIYLLMYFLFIVSFAGYLVAATIAFLILIRIIHGLSFGSLMTTSNALVIDILPRLRQGEGLGYFGLSGTLAMATGPLIGLLIYDNFDFNVIFYAALAAGTLGCIFAFFIKARHLRKPKKEPITIDRFIIVKGIPIGFNYLLLAIPYSMITTYIAVYSEEFGQSASAGIFFIVTSIGLIISRIFAGKNVDKGKIIETIKFGIILAAGSYFLLAFASYLPNPMLMYYIAGFLIGIAYGLIFPSFNVMFINLAPRNRRAAASSTYLVSWDTGIGIGIMLGGKIMDAFNTASIYTIGGVSAGLAAICFVAVSSGYFLKNKLR